MQMENVCDWAPQTPSQPLLLARLTISGELIRVAYPYRKLQTSQLTFHPKSARATTRSKLSDAVAYEPSITACMQYSGEPKGPHKQGILDMKITRRVVYLTRPLTRS